MNISFYNAYSVLLNRNELLSLYHCEKYNLIMCLTVNKITLVIRQLI